MTTDLAIRKIIRKDYDGNLYSIPENMIEDFAIMNEAVMLAEWGEEEWHDAVDALNSTYGPFRKE